MDNIKLIGKGSYGCVYYPGISCKGKKETRKQYVSKIVERSEDSLNEIKISKEIKKIDNYRKNFLVIDKYCEVYNSRIHKDIKENCHLFDGRKDKDNKSLILYSEYMDGLTIADILTNIENNKELIKFYNGFIKHFSHLLVGLNKLEKREIIHFDLKYSNILMNNRTGLPIIIDYGISLNMKDILKVGSYDTVKLSPTFYERMTYDTIGSFMYPLDVQIITYLCILKVHHNVDEISKDHLYNVVDQYINNNDLLKSEYNKNELRDKYYRFVNKIKISKIEKIILSMLKYWNTIDMYSLCCHYYIILKELRLNNTILIELKKILRNYIQLLPNERYNSEEMLSNISKLLHKKNMIGESVKMKKELKHINAEETTIRILQSVYK